MPSNDPERPFKTPDGFEFPYSHFGDPIERTQLLRNIGISLGLNPRTVVNMGSGYDVTPSDAFPSARVIHVDLHPPDNIEGAVDIVNFLRESGFEAYGSEELPDDLKADLVIDILGPGYEGVDLAPDAVVITTKRNIPEDMKIIGLVDNSDPRRIVTDRREMVALWSDVTQDNIHLVAIRKHSEEE